MTQLGSGQAALMSLIEQVNLRIQKQMSAKGGPDITMPKTIEIRRPVAENIFLVDQEGFLQYGYFYLVC